MLSDGGRNTDKMRVLALTTKLESMDDLGNEYLMFLSFSAS